MTQPLHIRDQTGALDLGGEVFTSIRVTNCPGLHLTNARIAGDGGALLDVSGSRGAVIRDMHLEGLPGAKDEYQTWTLDEWREVGNGLIDRDGAVTFETCQVYGVGNGAVLRAGSVLRNCTINGVARDGVKIGGSNVLVEGVKVRDLYAVHPDAHADLVQVHGGDDTLTGIIVRGCALDTRGDLSAGPTPWVQHGQGVFFGRKSDATHVAYRDCRIEDNTILVGGLKPIAIDYGEDMTIRGNLCSSAFGLERPPRIAVKGSGTITDNTVAMVNATGDWRVEGNVTWGGRPSQVNRRIDGQWQVVDQDSPADPGPLDPEPVQPHPDIARAFKLIEGMEADMANLKAALHGQPKP